jgi:hypothetical protein
MIREDLIESENKIYEAEVIYDEFYVIKQNNKIMQKNKEFSQLNSLKLGDISSIEIIELSSRDKLFMNLESLN